MQSVEAENFAQRGSQVWVEESFPTQLECQAGRSAADLHWAADAAGEQSDPDLQGQPAVADQPLQTGHMECLGLT